MQAYEHVLSLEGCPEKQLAMAREKLTKIKALREAEGLQAPSDDTENANPGNVSHRDYF